MFKKHLIGILCIVLSGTVLQSGFAQEVASSPESVKAITKKVADWQIATFEDSGKYRGLSEKFKKKQREGSLPDRWHDLQWQNAALYVGMDQWRRRRRGRIPTKYQRPSLGASAAISPFRFRPAKLHL